MPAAVVALRVLAVLALAAPVWITATGRRGGTQGRPTGGRAPLLANLAAFAVYVPTLVLSAGSTAGASALPMAAMGVLVALAGGALVLAARAVLGPAWSLVPRADPATEPVTTGPYRVVRHPIYLGYVSVTAGQALAFASWPALVVVLLGIVPTFAGRARAEEALLSRTLGERYDAYKRRTRMIIPYLL